MDKFSVKSILLGIGIGIIITSVASMIYFQGSPSSSDPGEKGMARLAEKYGYVKQEPAGSAGSVFIEGASDKADTAADTTIDATVNNKQGK